MQIMEKEFNKKTDHFNRDITKIEINLNQAKEGWHVLLTSKS